MLARRQPWTEPGARRALAAACAAWGIDPSGAGLLRLGTNASFRVGDVVVRVAPPGRTAEAVGVEVALAAHAARAGVAVAEPREDLPVVAAGEHRASAWAWVPHDAGSAAPPTPDGGAVGRLVRAFHDAVADAPLALPDWDQPAVAAERIAAMAESGAFADAELDAAREALDAARAGLASAGALDDPRPIHGDAHPGNVLLATAGPHRGRPVLLDLDYACRGPRAWDLAPFAADHRRYGGSRAWYDALRAGYGEPEGPAWPAVLRMRELAAALWFLAAERGPGRSAEAERRLAFVRGDADPPVWSAT